MRSRLGLLALLALLVLGGLFAYDQTGSCDVGPVSRAVRDALGQDYVTRCAG